MEVNWPVVSYVALALSTAEFLHRKGVNWIGQLIAGLSWPLYWGHCIAIAWRLRGRK